MIYDENQTRTFNRRSLVNEIKELVKIYNRNLKFWKIDINKKSAQPFNKRNLVSDIKDLVKDRIERKDGSYFLDEK